MKNKSLVLLFTALLFACGAPDKKAELEKLKGQRAKIEEKIAQLQKELGDTTSASATEVVAKTLEPTTFKTYIEIQGRVEAEESVSLSSEIPGTITKIHVKAGDKVSKGEVLAETDSRASQMQLSAMQTSLALVSQMYERQKSLWEQKIGTEMQYLQTKTAKEGLEAGVSALQEQVRMSKIVSPIDGVVDNVNIKLGQAVAPGLPAITVVNFNNLKVKADVAESYASRVKINNEVLVIFPDMQDSVRSKVSYASRAINPLSRTFNVEVPLDNKKEYHPNMVARIKINDYTSEKPVIVVPVKYIQKSASSSYVMLSENGKAVKRNIKIGREYSGMAEVQEGLKAGDQLIVEGYDLVNEGEKVQQAKL